MFDILTLRNVVISPHRNEILYLNTTRATEYNMNVVIESKYFISLGTNTYITYFTSVNA